MSVPEKKTKERTEIVEIAAYSEEAEQDVSIVFLWLVNLDGNIV